MHGLGGCALLLSVAMPATADPIQDAKSAGQKVTNSVSAPPTQAQVEQAKERLKQDLQRALAALEQRVSGVVAQKHQQLEQARQAVITQERSKVNELRRVHAKVPKLPTDMQSQSSSHPSSEKVGGLSSATHAAAAPQARLTASAALDPLKLESTTTDGGGPEVPVGLIGSGFTPGCEVHFRVSASRDVTVRPDWVGSDAMTVALPADLTGLAPYNGLVYVKREDGQTSGSRPFVFRPRMEVAAVDGMYLHPACHAGEGCLGWNQANGFRIGHVSVLAPPVSGTDQLASGIRLKNGWVVDHVELSGTYGTTSVVGLHPGSDDLAFQIQWTTGTVPFLVMYVAAATAYKVLAIGPAGLSYK